MDFDLHAARIEKLLKARALDGYEIMLGASRNLSIEVREQKVDTFKCSEPVGVGIRVLKDGGMGFSFSTSMDDKDLERMVANAVTGAEFQTKDACNCLPGPAAYPQLSGLADEKLAGVGEEEKISRVIELERLTLAEDPRMKKVRKSSYGESRYEVLIRNSRGVEGNYSGTSVSCSVSAVAEEDGDSQMGWDFGFSNYFDKIDVAVIAKNAAAKASGMLGARAMATMKCPVILDNYVAAEVLEVLASSFLAENVQKGKSILAGRKGARLFAQDMIIVDDGLLAGGMATTPFDGEGVPGQRTVLVEDGAVQGFLYNSYCACKDGVASTGNAVRGGVKGLPRMGVTNFFIENGVTPTADLAKGVETGVLLTSVMGMHTANPVSGDFSVGAAGYFIENGMVAYPVKGIVISGNILDLFHDVSGVGNDLRFFGGVGSPSLRIEGLDVSGK
ncbi:TldD/PmbA family protein [Geotalea sp. SG265]|uniref:TldD/PmbA family protein n=1 Tax=Geotalea sp. SG265 TaxID=2922867 RepID=UPI001FB026D3|nr:TldD/PmbA family protein [Geotalea sp. SG265]